MRAELDLEEPVLDQRGPESESLFYYLPNPFFRLRLTPNNTQLVSFWDVLRSMGARSDSPEELMAALKGVSGARKLVLTNSGRSALLLALKSLGVKEGDEVILPAVSCHSVADSIIESGATPVLAEIKKADGTIDPDQLSACMTDRTKAIVAIHYLGLPCDISEIMEKAAPRNITVVGDCAQALGSRYGQDSVGARTPLSFYSFGPDKHLCFGTGGMLGVNSSEMSDRVDQAVPKAREGSGGSAYELLGRSLVHRKPLYGLGTIIKAPAFGLGYLRREQDVSFTLEAMSSLAMSYGLKHIKDMERSNKMRVENAKFLEESVKSSRAVDGIAYDSKKDPVFLKYTVLAEGRSQRLSLMKALKRRGIEAGPLNWRQPLHRWGNYPDQCRRRTSLKGADEFADRFLNLPCHPRMSGRDLEKLAQTLALF